MRHRKAVMCGFPAPLGAWGDHETATRYEVRFGESVEETTRHIREAGAPKARALTVPPLRFPTAPCALDQGDLVARIVRYLVPPLLAWTVVIHVSSKGWL